MHILDPLQPECEDYNTILSYIDTYGKVIVQRKEIKRSLISDTPIPLFSKLVQIGSKLWLFGNSCYVICTIKYFK